MRYYYHGGRELYADAIIYECPAHPRYNACTLFQKGDIGLAIVQQRFNPKQKCTWWGPIDPDLANDIFAHNGFHEYFIQHAEASDADGFYPTVPIRKVMWALRMKPLEKAFWEHEL